MSIPERFGLSEVDKLLHFWARNPTWHKREDHQFYRLIGAYFRAAESPDFATFWDHCKEAVAEAAREFPEDLSEERRAGELEWYRGKAQTIFDYELVNRS